MLYVFDFEGHEVKADPVTLNIVSTLRSGITDNVVTQPWAIKVLGTLNNGCTSQPKLLVYKTEASALFPTYEI
jgi:hypothetical protein